MSTLATGRPGAYLRSSLAAAARGLITAFNTNKTSWVGLAVFVVVALILVSAGVSSAKPPLWSIPTQFLAGAAAATGIATINSIGYLGGFAGPFLIGWIKE